MNWIFSTDNVEVVEAVAARSPFTQWIYSEHWKDCIICWVSYSLVTRAQPRSIPSRLTSIVSVSIAYLLFSVYLTLIASQLYICFIARWVRRSRKCYGCYLCLSSSHFSRTMPSTGRPSPISAVLLSHVNLIAMCSDCLSMAWSNQSRVVGIWNMCFRHDIGLVIYSISVQHVLLIWTPP